MKLYYSIKSFFRKIRRSYLYTKYVFQTNDYDWEPSYLFKLLALKFKFMAENTKHWHVARADRDKKEFIIAYEICTRLSSDFYWNQYESLVKKDPDLKKAEVNWNNINECLKERRQSKYYKYDQFLYQKFHTNHPKEDLAYLCKLIQRKSLNSWWD